MHVVHHEQLKQRVLERVFLSRFAKVPCGDVILHARASSSSTSVGVKELSNIPLSHSEQGVHRVLQENGHTVPVPFEYVDLPSQKAVPCIKFSSWVQYLARTDRLHYITGAKTVKRRQELCREYWRRMKDLRPDLPLFQWEKDSKLDLGCVIPILHHGDEGRSYRKLPLMVLSTHGVLGQGSWQSEHLKSKKEPAMDENPLNLNFIGSTMLTHYVFATLPQCLYKHHPEALDTMLSIYAADLRALALEGVDVLDGGELKRLRFYCVGSKGDLPYLGKAGHFCRTYSMCPKKATSKKQCDGICFMCLGGSEKTAEPTPWEDFNLNARWRQTIGSSSMPGYDEAGPLLQVPHDHPWLFYRLDAWHCFHLGCGKTFAAAAIAVLAENKPELGKMDLRMEYFTRDYRRFCSRTKRYAYVSAINCDLLGWEHTGLMPQGHWHKGFITTNLLSWLEDFVAKEWQDTDDPLIREIAPRSKTCIPFLDCFAVVFYSGI